MEVNSTEDGAACVEEVEREIMAEEVSIEGAAVDEEDIATEVERVVDGVTEEPMIDEVILDARLLETLEEATADVDAEVDVAMELDKELELMVELGMILVEGLEPIPRDELEIEVESIVDEKLVENEDETVEEDTGNEVLVDDVGEIGDDDETLVEERWVDVGEVVDCSVVCELEVCWLELCWLNVDDEDFVVGPGIMTVTCCLSDHVSIPSKAGDIPTVWVAPMHELLMVLASIAGRM